MSETLSVALNIERVLALPEVLAPSTMYIVRDDNEHHVELHFTDALGETLRHLPTRTEILDIVVKQAGDLVTTEYASDIDARNALTFVRNAMCFVADASADPTVGTGSAMYYYVASTQTWVKVSEFESLDIRLVWNAIEGRPVSAVGDIDDAVDKRHAHDNKVVLDNLGEDVDGNLLYRGRVPKAALSKAEW